MGTLRFVADLSDSQVTVWACDWHLKWGGSSLTGLSSDPVGSDVISR